MSFWKLQTTLSQGSIADNDVVIYVDEVQKQLYDDYIITPYDGSSDRLISFSTAPADGSVVKIFVHTAADYHIHRHAHEEGGAGNSIHFREDVNI